MIGLEYVAYFLLFDTWFYWLHRLMHHGTDLHLGAQAPSPLDFAQSAHDHVGQSLESLVNGGFVPLFTALFTVHHETMMLITPTNIIMGLYVHSGYEFLPRWWNKTWATKWFITATFHDQHHKYFRWNFGGYTTIWDRICGTTRTNFEKDFEQIKARVSETQLTPAVAMQGNSPES